MFGFIKNLFGGIAAFFSGLFGSKKSQENTLTASKTQDKTSSAPKPQDKTSNAPKAQGNTSNAPKTKKSKGYYLEIDDSGNVNTEAQAKKPEPSKATVATAERPKVEPAPKAETPEPAKNAPAKTKTASQNGKAPEVKVEAQPNPPVAASNGKVSAQEELTFAPKYLVPTATSSRRRPGPSMDMFRDMARQVKTPN
jgi:hypothetical protein